GRRRLVPAGIYCCDRSVLGYIPPKGYFDLKEQLVPALRKAGLRVGAVLLPGQTCEVLNWPTYMRLLSDALSREQIATEGYVQLAPGIWSGEDVRITPHARIVGPALLGHRCTIEDGATIVGPAVLGEGCHVAEGAWVIRTAASAGASIGRNACVSDAIVPAGQPGLRPSSTIGERETLPAGTRASDVQATPAFKKLMVRMPIPILMFGAFVWAFSHIIERLWQVWQSNPDYSVGQLVPLAALYMIWMNRSRLNGVTLQPSMGGVAALACGVAVCTIGAYFLYFSLEGVGMVVCANAIVWALVGWGGYKRLGAPLLFLFLMLPLPGQVHNAVMLPLQSFCARVSATVLETAGVPVVRYGHILEVAGRQTAVAEACNGLRMAMAFLIVTAVVAYVINRPLWQKIIVVFSSIPIALGCNVARIVAMAYSYGAGYEWLVEGPLHTGTGLLMMPLALALVMLELAVLSNLTTPAAWDKDSRSVAAIPVASGT
ncbi:MAG: exosortase, partial [Phycisphaerae bacterium]